MIKKWFLLFFYFFLKGVKLDELTAERNDLMVQLQAQEKLQLEVIELRATNAQLGDQVTLLNMTTTTTKFDIAEEEHARETVEFHKKKF